jgi:hypothetical protein
MEINRNVDQGGKEIAKQRISFCLDQLEKYGFKNGVEFNTNIAYHLTVEEIVGALVAAEQALEEG